MNESTYKVGQRVQVRDADGNWHKATVYNVNFYRPPDMRYALDVDGYTKDYVFVGESQLKESEE